MKRSQKVSLMVLGATALLAGCSPDYGQDVKQDRYASLADCNRDWGDPTVCSSAGVGNGGYVGPRYYWSHGGGYPVAIMPDGTERSMSNTYVARGTPSLSEGTVTVGTHASVGGEGGVAHGGFGGSAHGESAGG
ncbi:hypothetical protein AB4Y45_32925 [Paraburkholderia sp. EG287A]|uniref:hypothetical protein n=1 Tax=Paraburkholderia sp. EG287A TaxID=3237012 RepID=UPI0034D214DA